MNTMKLSVLLSALSVIALLASGCARSGEYDAVYLGVKNYGADKTNADNKNKFNYLFDTDGRTLAFKMSNGAKDEEGNYDYPLQNQLKEEYLYHITVENGTVTALREIAEASASNYSPPVSGIPGETTLKNLLKTALAPVGTTLYIYGGGWDWQDAGSAVQTRTLGVSPDWVKFYEAQDENYTYKDADEAKPDPANSYYPYGGYNEYYYAGLDCSGYLGWILYNTFETENGNDGYVGGSTGFAKRLSAKGWGEWTQDIKAPDGANGYTMKPGDIMSINGHVWISLGTCEDGSVVILHSTPSPSRSDQPGGGVQISAIGLGRDCDAYLLADRYMSEYYPDWYARYPVHLCDPEKYFTFEGENAGRFTWSTDTGLTDPDGLQDRMPEDVLALLFR